VPGVDGIVTALHDLAPGEAWPRGEVARMADTVRGAGFRLAAVESVPVHEEIKLGHPGRDRRIDAFCRSLRSVGEEGIPVVCYNFMPVFDWTRTSLEMPLDDGSTALAYDHAELSRIDLARGSGELPGWGAAYDGPTLAALRAAYAGVDAERMWENLAHFLERAVPAAADAGVRLALHPDDPPWEVLGLPRIITGGAALERAAALVDSPANGVTLCTGSLGARPEEDVPAAVRRLGPRIAFAHCRNVRVTGPRRFHEAPHPSRFGGVDMAAVLRALRDVGFDGPMRPDHGRRIWGEEGRPGYGLYDRALGAMYLQGLWEALSHDGA
jgi:mannonate dehydratase